MPDRAPFTEETIKEAWDNSQGYCQCERTTHGHTGKHLKMLMWNSQRITASNFSWVAHHIGDPSDNSLSNCEIICCSCHSQIAPY